MDFLGKLLKVEEEDPCPRWDVQTGLAANCRDITRRYDWEPSPDAWALKTISVSSDRLLIGVVIDIPSGWAYANYEAVKRDGQKFYVRKGANIGGLGVDDQQCPNHEVIVLPVCGEYPYYFPTAFSEEHVNDFCTRAEAGEDVSLLPRITRACVMSSNLEV